MISSAASIKKGTYYALPVFVAQNPTSVHLQWGSNQSLKRRQITNRNHLISVEISQSNFCEMKFYYLQANQCAPVDPHKYNYARTHTRTHIVWRIDRHQSIIRNVKRRQRQK